MSLDPSLLPPLIFFAALAYASVGHGGASAYLALGSLASLPASGLRVSALELNLAVSALAFWQLSRAGHRPWRMLGVLLAGSAPAAFLSSRWSAEGGISHALLGISLALAAARLAWPAALVSETAPRPPRGILLALIGAVLGVVSGLSGVGGGIYLSPLLLLAGWAGLRDTAACSAGFIFVNSAASLAGLASSGQALAPDPFWLGAALAGGLAGAWLGATKASPRALRLTLACVMLVAAFKSLSRSFHA